MKRLNPAVFLDRDGTLIRDAGYMKDHRQIRFYTGVPQALKKLKKSGYKLIVITNQSGVGRGFLTMKHLGRIHQSLQYQLEVMGVSLDGIFVCHHHPNDRCSCRKPGLTLFIRARNRFGIDMKKSYLIGDRLSDVLPARRLGSNGILVLTGFGRRQALSLMRGRRFQIARDLKSAIHRILKGGHRHD